MEMLRDKELNFFPSEIEKEGEEREREVRERIGLRGGRLEQVSLVIEV